ncbi:hypothetical protein J8L85_16510 [Maribacter sp. MMG018]|uniref:hypothetical protein n=1 Tax=Maribacter sp. MMG018 TaxID=2822688 RepID=UPI001B366D05|nr:hypothetical protein [Maribacter sp. MMG018]MBQ4916058.1 hypothetical protein [Maribacter sp. MMG018]
MEPDKFEKYIKGKLEEREIAPSAGAWEKISGQLAKEKSNDKPLYFWLGIAASVVVLVGVTFLFFNDQGNVVPSETIKVVTADEDNVQKTELEKDVEGLVEKSSEEIVLTQKEVSPVIKENNVAVVKKNVVKDEISTESGDEALAEASEEKVLPNDNQLEILLPDSILNEKIAEVVAQVDSLELNGEITDAEVDSLLLKAQKDILRERLFNKDNSVNAMALLTEVEDELDQSFRDQILESLKTGFLKVRTAVADRNN